MEVDEDGRKKDVTDNHMSAKLPSDCFDHTSLAAFVFIDVFPRRFSYMTCRIF